MYCFIVLAKLQGYTWADMLHTPSVGAPCLILCRNHVSTLDAMTAAADEAGFASGYAGWVAAHLPAITKHVTCID